MTEFFLEARRRTILGKRTKQLRKDDRIPGVLYGHGIEAQSLDLSRIPFHKVWQAAGESSLIDVKIDAEQPVKVIIQDIQFDPVTGNVLHVDLHQVNMKEKVEVDVDLHFIGEAPAVKELGGTLVKDKDTIKVTCLPQDLVKEITVDVGVLKTFDDVIRVKDVALSQGLTLETQAEDQVAHVEAPRSEAELAELDTAVEEDVTKVEKVEKPKTEDDEAAAPAEAASSSTK